MAACWGNASIQAARISSAMGVTSAACAGAAGCGVDGAGAPPHAASTSRQHSADREGVARGLMVAPARGSRDHGTKSGAPAGQLASQNVQVQSSSSPAAQSATPSQERPTPMQVPSSQAISAGPQAGLHWASS